MTDRELMQQALEALERYGGVDQRACDAEEALRERLAQPEQPIQCMCGICKLGPRQWQGLTDDDIAQAMYRADAIITGPMQFKFAREIEAKLKEQNT